MARKAGVVSAETKERILAAATAEFSRRGFAGASLRRICAEAGVTTGSVYFFFEGKEDLFASVVTPVMERALFLMKSHFAAELSNPATLEDEGEEEDIRSVAALVGVYYRNREVCDIVLANRDRPCVEAFFNELVELLDRQTVLLLSALHSEEPARTVPISDYTIHWVSHLQMDAVFTLLSHDLGEQRSIEELRAMVRFLRAGLMSLMTEKRLP